VYHCFINFKEIGKPMVKSSVSSKRPNGAMSVVGTGVLVGLFLSASALTQASAVYSDSSSGGSSVQLGESSTSAGRVKVRFITPPSFSGAVTAMSVAQLPEARPTVAVALAPPTVAPGPSAPILASALATLVPPAVNPQQIMAAAPPVVPRATAQPVGPAAFSVAAISVPEPSTIVLLLGGFIALIGIRRFRAVSAKKG
jgi:hypothetical protein